MNNMLIRSNDILFAGSETDNRIHLEICIENIEVIDNPTINAIFLILDSAIGEYDVVSKIGKVDVKSYSLLKNHEKLFRLEELPGLVDLLK